ncbi:MAG: hypothetical protein WDN72_03380 [Alphaproteobacteria bacterium]
MRVRNFWKLVSCAFFLALAGSNAWALPGGCAVGYDSNRMARNNVNIEGMGAPPGAKEELSPDVLSTLQAKMAEDFTTAVGAQSILHQESALFSLGPCPVA